MRPYVSTQNKQNSYDVKHRNENNTEKGVPAVSKDQQHAIAMIDSLKAMLAAGPEITLTESEIFGLILILDSISQAIKAGG